jgi:hypothetical protein
LCATHIEHLVAVDAPQPREKIGAAPNNSPRRQQSRNYLPALSDFNLFALLEESLNLRKG